MPQQPVGLSLSEALQISEYLRGRGLLCSGCGFRLVELENQFNSHCNDCQIKSQQYRPRFGRVNDFEKVLSERLGEFVQRFTAGGADQSSGPKTSGKPASGVGKA